jgi:hypothetical protein
MLRTQFARALILSSLFGAAASPGTAAPSTSALVAQIDNTCAATETVTKTRPSAILARTDTLATSRDPWRHVSERAYAALLKSDNTNDDLALVWTRRSAISWVQLVSQTPRGRSLASYCFRRDGSLAMVSQHAYDPVRGFNLRQTVYTDPHGTIIERTHRETAGDAAIWTDVHDLPFYHALAQPS